MIPGPGMRWRWKVQVYAGRLSPPVWGCHTSALQDAWTGASVDGAGVGGAATGVGVSRIDATYPTTTATITSGITARPSDSSNRVASNTEVIGSFNITAHIAPMPMATPGTSGSPGRCDSAIPPAAPRNIAGKTGPHRKLLSDT